MHLIWNYLFLRSNTVLGRKQMCKADTLTAEHETNQQTELDTPPLLGKNELVLPSGGLIHVCNIG